jgi:hypothetical protein
VIEFPVDEPEEAWSLDDDVVEAIERDAEVTAVALARMIDRDDQHQFEADLPLDDVVEDVRGFGRQFRLADEYGLWVPCQVFPDAPPRPISSGALAEAHASHRLVADELSRDRLLEQLDAEFEEQAQLVDGRTMSIGRLDPGTAKSGLVQRAYQFLRQRLFVAKAKPDSPRESPIRVVTRDDGWRISCSPAYFVRPRYFGAPSSPVDGTVDPGIWIFGVDRGAGIAWDAAEFRIPPTTHAELMVG